MRRTLMYFIPVLVSCMVQFMVVAVAQQQPSETTGEQVGATANTTPGAADGTSGPALTGVRRPLYRLRSSDVVEIDITFSPQFNQLLTVQPDGFLPLKGVPQLNAENLTVPELQIRERSPGSKMLGWGLAADDYILFLGRFSPEKNCHLLIDAYEKLETSLKLVLAGGSSHTSPYIKQLRAHASDRILFLDWVSGEPLTELLTNAALFVLPSDLEGLSLALLDAMGSGVCVLTSDIPENREVVQDAGFTFRAGDRDDLARMLALLVSDPETRAAAGRMEKQIIQSRYLWPHIAGQISAVYQELMGTKGVCDHVASVSLESKAEETERVV